MGFAGTFFFVSLFLIHLLTLSSSQRELEFKECLLDRGNFTSKSTYQASLNHIFSSFTSDTENDYGFYNISFGQNSDQVNAIALCRGDVIPFDCINCIKDAAAGLKSLCPNQKAAILSASSGDSHRKFATGTVAASDSLPIYALVQCTPDLSQQQCTSCLSIGKIKVCCEGGLGGRAVGPNCNLRFETYSFYDPPAEPSTTSPAPLPRPVPPQSPLPSDDTHKVVPGKEGNSSRIIIIIVISAVAFLILNICSCICIFYLMKKSKKRRNLKQEIEDRDNSGEALQFDFDTIRMATNNFSSMNKLGQGGFGAVYKGKLLSGKEIAVKRLLESSAQGELEFKNEVSLMARLQHRNLVRLLGFCLEGNERLLIYEFVPNSSLNHFIFDPIKRLELDCDTRHKIIGGISKGILYLHEDSYYRIIHRDLKASNILLDAKMNPKISDFGLARLFVGDQTQADTRRIAGTFGYMAPEYTRRGHISVKSDVYSFGVLVLEIISGQKVNLSIGEDGEDLLTFAWKNWMEGTAQNLIDPILRDGSSGEMMRCIQIGLLCVQEDVARRPTMASVVLMLSSSPGSLPLPLKPAYYMHSVMELEASTNRPAQFTVNHVSISDIDPR
ncbi:hypothetical protein SLEP1_g29554 [Rubroshorea leprosula]|uniref:Uncharacterized protein n=1 Tax=Rubroshorea leprosula TaxID=152421 RepID=A0AAV5JX96_9ROSI|nr:hypothetical protein SLEP1_g29554 [Rubroshorea leprosula]